MRPVQPGGRPATILAFNGSAGVVIAAALGATRSRVAVEFASGRPVSPPIMPGCDGFPVADWLEEKFSCSVLVDNDVNVMALGEREYLFAGEDEFMFVKVGTGIGAGLIVGGHLHRGAAGIGRGHRSHLCPGP